MSTDEALQEQAAMRASQLPEAELTHQATGDWKVWKVGGKVFMLQTSMPGEPVVILKPDPNEADLLRRAHESITHGYHMNKKHWITLRPGGKLPDQLIDELVTESYLLVVKGLPDSKRPVDPETFEPQTISRPDTGLSAT